MDAFLLSQAEFPVSSREFFSLVIRYSARHTARGRKFCLSSGARPVTRTGDASVVNLND